MGFDECRGMKELEAVEGGGGDVWEKKAEEGHVLLGQFWKPLVRARCSLRCVCSLGEESNEDQAHEKGSNQNANGTWKLTTLGLLTKCLVPGPVSLLTSLKKRSQKRSQNRSQSIEIAGSEK